MQQTAVNKKQRIKNTLLAKREKGRIGWKSVRREQCVYATIATATAQFRICNVRWTSRTQQEIDRTFKHIVDCRGTLHCH